MDKYIPIELKINNKFAGIGITDGKCDKYGRFYCVGESFGAFFYPTDLNFKLSKRKFKFCQKLAESFNGQLYYNS